VAAEEKGSKEAGSEKSKKKFPLMTVGLIGGIAIAQAVGFFVFIKMFYATPAPTYGAGGEHVLADGHGAPDGDAGKGHAEPAKGGDAGGHGDAGKAGAVDPAAAAALIGKTAEVELVKKYKVPNNSRGIAYIYDFDIAMVVPGPQREHAAALVSANQAQIYDRIGQIVRAAPARVLDEVDFRSLRMQIREALHEIFGEEDLVQQVLIPRCVPIRTD
jgi:hypothetical protein